MNNLKITNIKVSFYVNKKFELLQQDGLIEYFNKHVHIIKFGGYTCSLLPPGRDYHVNLTGIRSLSEIEDSTNLLFQIGNISREDLIGEIQTDCISATASVRPGLRRALIATSTLIEYQVRQAPRFCGIIIKRKPCSTPTIIYFNTGKLNIVGGKSVSGIRFEYEKFCEFVKDLR